MAIRMTGLTSGLDTESIVAALMEAQKSKKTKVENKKTKLEWTQTIWSGLNKKLYSFYTDYAGKMRFQSSYLTKKAASSDSSVLTATAKSSAANGSYSVKVSWQQHSMSPVQSLAPIRRRMRTVSRLIRLLPLRQSSLTWDLIPPAVLPSRLHQEIPRSISMWIRILP